MRKFFDQYAAALPLILLSLYSLGYTYFSVYYINFGINMEYYISLMDLIFFSIDTLFLILIFLIIAQGALDLIFSTVFEKLILPIFVWLNRKKRTSIKTFVRYYKIHDKGEIYIAYRGFMLTILVFGIILTFVFSNPFREIYFALPVFSILFFLIYEDKNIISKNYKRAYIGFMVFCIIGLILLAKNDSTLVKSGELHKKIEFSIEDEIFSTVNSEFNFIGETSNYLFLYNKLTKETLTFNKSEISLIKTKADK